MSESGPSYPLTARQRFWLQMADEDRRNGNDFAADIFTLIGQPSERERREAASEARE